MSFLRFSLAHRRRRASDTLAGLSAAFIFVAIPVAASAESPPPVDGGKIGVLVIGPYACETPGDATGKAGVAIPDMAFSVVNGSSYKAQGQRGSYLLTGDTIVFTSGKMAGTRMKRVSRNRLQVVDAQGVPGPVRCVLSKAVF